LFGGENFYADTALLELLDAGLVVGDGEDYEIVLCAGDHLAVEGHAEGGIEDDAKERSAPAEAAAVGEHGVVGEDGVDASESGICLPTKGLDGGAGFFAGDPEGLSEMVLADGRGDAAVEGHGNFHEDERAAVLAPASEALVEATGFRLTDAEGNFNACRT